MLALIILINRSGAMVIPFLGVYMANALNFSIKEIGTILSCFGLGAIAGSFLGGWLSDKIGHFLVQLYCLILSIPVFFLLPELKTPLSLSLGVFFLSVVTETFRPANSVAIASYSNPDNITKAFSLNRMAINLGFSIGPALGGFLAAFSYQLLFYGNGITSGIAGIVFYLYFRKLKGAKQPENIAESADTAISPWKDSKFLFFSFLCCLYSICFFQLLSTLPLFYREVKHLDEFEIGLILGFSGLVVFSLEMLLVHNAEKHMSAASAIIIGTLLCGISYMMLIFSGGFGLLYSSIFVLCISEILAMPFMASVTIQRAPKGKQGAYMSLNALTFSAAHILSPFLGTRIASHYGFSSLWMATGAVSLVAALGFGWIMKRI